ncbi:AzlC family ABC transporter permease [Clostridium sp. DJ247]|uniref:AzlC family ABC transporter permease n=1 Tax=Clostridium sp. DJ247 TaxID=2726188 RepID=UPI001624D163|nr:AzlC family ABC transporter permease [Clostridium sp. DJ247]MBC2581465.1 AzlC family ABC transporter permease [Clostridium sp. DJ247]
MVEHINKEVTKINAKKDSICKLDYFVRGIKAGIPISIGYIPIAITFALISKSSGIPNLISICMSLFIYAGASQFIGVNLMAMGASTLEIVLTTFILNFRHFLMSSSLSQRIAENTSIKLLSVLAYGITDETFAVASLKEEEKINPWFILGLNIIAFASWNFGTCIGLLLGDILPETSLE